MTDPHEDLLNEWQRSPRHREQVFIRDGIIAQEQWNGSSPKILFLLKEAYDEPGTVQGWDLREVIRASWQGPRYNLWYTVAYLAHGVGAWARNEDLGFHELNASRGEIVRALLGSAVVNIKKSSGKSSSSIEDLMIYVDEDGARIQAQVNLIAPDIVICGNTWQYARRLWPEAEPCHDRAWRVQDRLFLDIAHPANRYPRWLNYYALIGLLEGVERSGRSPFRGALVQGASDK